MKPLTISFLISLCIAFSFVPAAAQTIDPPDEAFVTGVPSHAQSFVLSCESRSASDWAAYFGVEVSETTFLDNLPRSDNPEKGFVGNPNGNWGNIPPLSYGVHAAPVAAGLRGIGLQAESLKGMSWDDLRGEIASGQPVIVWIIGQMWAGTPVRYIADDGEPVTVAYYEHVMILTGYSPGAVYVIDAYSGLHQTYSLDTFLNSWSVLGNQAVIYTGDGLPQASQDRLAGETYTVQPGDYLNGLAEQFNIAWQDLADWNRLDSPYTIYAGQVLVISPEENAPASEPTREQLVEPPASKPGIHSVGAGDTLLEIATRYNTTWEQLAALNGLIYPYFIYPQMELHLPQDVQPTVAENPDAPAEAQASPEVLEPQEPATPDTYAVQGGDGLIAIASQFGLDWRALAELNGIEYPYTVYPGRILLLR